jgi:hypothetical protein
MGSIPVEATNTMICKSFNFLEMKETYFAYP